MVWSSPPPPSGWVPGKHFFLPGALRRKIFVFGIRFFFGNLLKKNHLKHNFQDFFKPLNQAEFEGEANPTEGGVYLPGQALQGKI